MFEFFNSLVSLPDTKEDWTKSMLNVLDKMNEGRNRTFQFPNVEPDKDVTVDVEKPEAVAQE